METKENSGRIATFWGNLKDYFINAKTDQKNQKVIINVASVTLTILIVLFSYIIINSAFFTPTSMFDKDPIEVQISRGASLTQISKDLESKGLIKNSTVFKLYVDFSDYSSKIKSGSYSLNKTMTMKEITRELTKGGVSDSEVSVSIPEGMTVEDIAQRLKDKGVITDIESFKKECDNIDNYLEFPFIAALKDKTSGRRYALEGYLFPDTYIFYTGSTNKEVINKMLTQFNHIYSQEWIEKSQKMGMSVDDIVTIASMVEKEAGRNDFYKVSAVFHNRLGKNMRMDSDATVQYALRIKRLALTSEDISVNSPFNTYKVKGLPAGPICNPGKAAMQAALNPDQDFVKAKYLFFATKNPDSMELVFAKTQAEHDKNVAQFRPLWEEYDRKKSGK